MEDQSIINQAIEEIKQGEYSCILIKDGEIIHRDSGRGVSPLIRLYDSPEGRELLKGATVIDKIIGKAAAMITALGGAAFVHGEMMSKSGIKFLEERSIPYSFGVEVEGINNFSGDGICPIEKSVIDIDDLNVGYESIKKTIAMLMKK